MHGSSIGGVCLQCFKSSSAKASVECVPAFTECKCVWSVLIEVNVYVFEGARCQWLQTLNKSTQTRCTEAESSPLSVSANTVEKLPVLFQIHLKLTTAHHCVYHDDWLCPRHPNPTILLLIYWYSTVFGQNLDIFQHINNSWILNAGWERLLNTLWTSTMEMWADSGGHIPYNRVWIEMDKMCLIQQQPISQAFRQHLMTQRCHF